MRHIIFLLASTFLLNGNAANKPADIDSPESPNTELASAQYTPLVPIGDFPEDISKLNHVDERFIKETDSWNSYRISIDKITTKERKFYSDKDIKQESKYLNNEMVVVETFRSSGGLIKAQYYKKGVIFLTLTSTSHDGKIDVKEYFHNGILKYSEYSNGINEDMLPRWYAAEM